MLVRLTREEMEILLRQHESTRSHGGWQKFLVDLQGKVNPITREIELSDSDLERIPRYAFDYGQGGWENRLVGAFGRVLGSRLGHTQQAAYVLT
jgi:hypothetical protein